jgi:hypothetical protein
MSEWIVQAPKQAGDWQVAVGFHLGIFKGVEEYKMQDGSVKWRFAWEVQKGQEQGKLATALTDRKISPTTLPGALITGLLGRPLVAGEDVKAAVDACVNKAYLVNVQPGPKGGKPGVRSVGQPPPM